MYARNKSIDTYAHHYASNMRGVEFTNVILNLIVVQPTNFAKAGAIWRYNQCRWSYIIITSRINIILYPNFNQCWSTMSCPCKTLYLLPYVVSCIDNYCEVVIILQLHLRAIVSVAIRYLPMRFVSAFFSWWYHPECTATCIINR